MIKVETKAEHIAPALKVANKGVVASIRSGKIDDETSF
jgi:hypothetical protein